MVPGDLLILRKLQIRTNIHFLNFSNPAKNQ
jgi:hypothetical protein